MQKILRYINLATLLLLVISAIVLFVFINNTNIDDFELMEFNNSTYKKTFQFSSIDTTNTSNLVSDFPYKEYLSGTEFGNPKKIDSSLNDFLLFLGDTVMVQNVLLEAYTTKLDSIYKFSSYDSLNMILTWADNILPYSMKDKTNKYFYIAIHGYWYENISKKLEKNIDDKYSFQFRYLYERCKNNNYISNLDVSNKDKVFKYTIESRWSYMFKRFWNNTEIGFKILVMLLFSITIISYICLFKRILKTLKTKYYANKNKN